MLIRSSGSIGESVHLCTLGRSCCYVARAEGGCIIFDPGASVHIPLLMERLKQLGFAPADIRYVILTHGHAERMAGAARLKRLSPALKLVGSQGLQDELLRPAFADEVRREDAQIASYFPQLAAEAAGHSADLPPLKMDIVVKDGDRMPLGPALELHAVAFPGHTAHSLAYLLQPEHFLIVDEVAGYFQGRQLAAPGGDADLLLQTEAVRRMHDLELEGLCLPYQGVLTGDLLQKHFADILINTQDLIDQCRTALAGGVPHDEVKAAVENSFYTAPGGDRVVQHSMRRTLEAVWRQVAG